MTARIALFGCLVAPASPFALGSARTSGRVFQRNAANENQDSARPPWDIGRFVKTAVFFDAFPNPLKGVARALSGTTAAPTLPPKSLLWSPGANPHGIVWGPLDDVVMGGGSQSSFSAQDGAWRGNIVTAGGGFAGVRTKLLEPPLDLSSCRGLRLRLRGGAGRRFKFIVRDDTDWNGIGWTISFDTPRSGSKNVDLAFRDFIPTRFADVIRPPVVGAPPALNLKSVRALQLTFSKFEYGGALNPNFNAGPFELVLEGIETI